MNNQQLPVDMSERDKSASSNKRAGTFLASWHIFSSAGLNVAAYRRSVIADDGETITGEKICLKLIATTKKGPRSYGSAKKPGEYISLEVDGEPLLALHAVLAGVLPGYQWRVPRRQREVKVLRAVYDPGREKQGVAPYSISLTEGERKYTATFSYADAWAFRMVLGQTLQAQFPGLGCALLLQSHLAMAETAARQGNWSQ